MLLDLNKIHAPRERLREGLPARGVFGRGGDLPCRRARVRWRSTSSRTSSTFSLTGTVTTTLELPCSRCLEPFTPPVDSKFDLRYQPHTHAAGSGHEAEREIEEDDLSTAFYDNERDRSRRTDARAVLPVAADEAAVQRRLPGALPDLRDESEPRHVRLQARLGRSEAGGAEDAEDRSTQRTLRTPRKSRPSLRIYLCVLRVLCVENNRRKRETMPNPKRRHSKTRTAKRRTHDALEAVGLSECPHCHEPSRRTACARTAGTTAAGRRGRSRRTSQDGCLVRVPGAWCCAGCRSGQGTEQLAPSTPHSTWHMAPSTAPGTQH